MKKFLIALLVVLQLLVARENQELSEIYTEFTQTVTVKYSRTIKVRTKKAYSESNSVKDVVYFWNKINNQRDTNKLYYLYAPEVLYYGKNLKDSNCIKDKRKFYKKHPFFSQSIDNLYVVKLDDDLYKVYFDKYVRIKENGRVKKYPSYLVVGYVNGVPFIFVEGDSVTDRNLLKKYKKSH